MASSSTIKAPALQAEKLGADKLPLKNRSLHLSVEVREEQILACLLDKHDNQYMAWASFPYGNKGFTLEKILDDEFMANPVSGVSVSFTANSFVLVPALYFKKEAVQDYLHAQLLDKADETSCYDYIKNLDSYNLYTVNANLALLRNKYPNALFRHHSSIFIENILTKNKNTQDDKVYVCVFASYTDVVVLHTGKLILANRYYYKNGSDFMYHLLWVYEQLQLNAEKTPCIFYGEISGDSEIFLLAAHYIKNVKTGEPTSLPAFSAALNSLPAHRYHSLFTQYLCV